jgi:glycosyltransferase involved in cell wall biosynthesis
MEKIRWLNWATIDLERGIGGVEVHGRSLARALGELGVECGYSRDLKDLQNLEHSPWDVIHTRGSFLPTLLSLRQWMDKRFLNKKNRPVWIHSLHGETLGRMRACGEWTWPGGYQAAAREYAAVLQSDIIFGDHENLNLFQWGLKLGKPCVSTWHGWDAFEGTLRPEPLPIAIERELNLRKPYWVFLGRGSDPVKGADLLIEAMELIDNVQVVATPGPGFESAPKVFKTGVLTSGQVKTVLSQAQGLVLPSRYEGFGIVVLEALSEGILVVATPVFGLQTLPKSLEGLIFAPGHSAKDIADTLRKASALPTDLESQNKRRIANRAILPTWRKVAEKVLPVVQGFISSRA